MKIIVLGLLAAAIFAIPASATVYVPGDAQFTLLPEPGKTISNSPVINGYFGVVPSASGKFTDDFEFTIPQNGVGSTSLTTTANLSTSSNYIQFLSATFNGTVIPISVLIPPSGGIQQTGALTNVPIAVNVLNILEVTYTTLGAGSYGGQLTFDRTAADPAAVPEPTTWTAFLLGFGILGLAVRRNHRKSQAMAWARIAA